MTGESHIQIATLLWEGRTVEVRYNPCWLGDGGVVHLEIECIDPPNGPLPITETGYRSAFFDGGEDGDLPGGDFVAFVRDWLDGDAQSKTWRRYVEASRQLSLF